MPSETPDETSVPVGLLGPSPTPRRLSTQAQSGDAGYTLSWWTVDGGGAIFSENGGYSLGSTIAQPDAAVWGGSGYTLAGGFWGAALVEHHVYLPVGLRDS